MILMGWGALGELVGGVAIIVSLIYVGVQVKDLPGIDRYWSQRRGFLHSGFANYVDGLLLRDAIETLDVCKRNEGAPDT
jgi:hypothetical protein